MSTLQPGKKDTRNKGKNTDGEESQANLLCLKLENELKGHLEQVFIRRESAVINRNRIIHKGMALNTV